MTIHHIRGAAALAVCALASAALAAGQPSFRIVAYMYQWGPPDGLTEGSPGTFYSVGGSAQQAALSITTQGSKTILTTFATSTYIQAPLVSAANRRFYSSIEKSINPANV